MVEFKLKINKNQRTAYFNRSIIDTLGFDLCAQLNAISGVIYPNNADKKQVVRSLKIILADIKHQAELEEKQNSKQSNDET